MGAKANAQQLRCHGFVVASLVKYIENSLSFDIFKIFFQRDVFGWCGDRRAAS
jgi:hypothetical protein